jgi:hypothetical protein
LKSPAVISRAAKGSVYRYAEKLPCLVSVALAIAALIAFGQWLGWLMPSARNGANAE